MDPTTLTVCIALGVFLGLLLTVVAAVILLAVIELWSWLPKPTPPDIRLFDPDGEPAAAA